jgi:hypothetical protein
MAPKNKRMHSNIPLRPLQIIRIDKAIDDYLSPRNDKLIKWQEEICECSPEEIDEEDVGNID